MAYIRTVLLVVAASAFLYVAGHTHASPVAATTLVDAVYIPTPAFVVTGKRYAFTWAGGGPAQTYTVKAVRHDGWVLVEVADEVTNPINFIPGENPVRWLNAGAAISIQEMRPHQ
jgi:hypothetical protein